MTNPVVRITWDIHENERRMMDFLEGKARGILREMGADAVWTGARLTGVGSAHDLGGLRMGADPKTSVVDPHLRLHEAPNLYVMSGGVFPSHIWYIETNHMKAKLIPMTAPPNITTQANGW